jgi:hypothetical protein
MNTIKKIIYVRCSNCKENFDENKVEFLNIEEDMQGRDILTFGCPKCKETQKSLRRG